MSLNTKRIVIALLSVAFIASLLFVQWMEIERKRAESGKVEPHIAIPESSRNCVECHVQSTPGIIDHWKGSTHAEKGVGCFECHEAGPQDVDGFEHYGKHVATVRSEERRVGQEGRART